MPDGIKEVGINKQSLQFIRFQNIQSFLLHVESNQDVNNDTKKEKDYIEGGLFLHSITSPFTESFCLNLILLRLKDYSKKVGKMKYGESLSRLSPVL